MIKRMRSLWPLLIAGSIGAMGVQPACADDYQLLVGSYTAGQSQGIYRLSFDSSTGQIDAKPLQVIKK
jgi:6-phosphogluconolactonase